MSISWKIIPLYGLAKQKQVTDCSERELLSVYLGLGVIPFSSKAEKRTNVTGTDLSKYQAVDYGDFVLNNQQAWRGSVGVSKYRGIVSPAYIVLKLSDDITTSYANYLFQSRSMVDQYVVCSKGVGTIQRNIYWDYLKRISVPLPPREEQDQIVRYLDWKVSQINKLINAKRRQIELLGELKRVVVNEAVTRDGDGWSQFRIKAAATILRGKFTHRPRNDPAFYDGNYPFIQTGDVARAGKYIREYKQTLNERGFSVSKQFPKGTLTMTIAANIGDVSILDFDACFPDSIIGLIPNKETDLEYLYYALFSMKADFVKEAPINTQGNLNVERVGAMTFYIPKIYEQRNIVSKIENRTVKIDKLIDKLNDEIALFAEYRTRLISDVVTGKLDVRDVAVPEYEVVEDVATDEDVKDMEEIE